MDNVPRPPDHRRNLPHYTPNDAPYFVTFNLDGALSGETRERLLSDNSKFRDFDAYLDKVSVGPNWLTQEPIAQIIQQRLTRLHDEVLTLHAFTIMSNHVHMMLALKPEQKLSQVTMSIKGATARECNKLLGRTGSFWQHESYDRVLRKNEYHAVVKYIINNPVKAGIVKQWREYRWTYLNPDLYFFD